MGVVLIIVVRVRIDGIVKSNIPEARIGFGTVSTLQDLGYVKVEHAKATS